MVCYISNGVRVCDSNVTALSTSKWKIEAELYEWLPGGIATLIGNLSGFVSAVINRLPDWLRHDMTIDEVYVADKTLVINVTITGADVETATIATSIIIAIIIAVAALIGLFIWRVTTTEIITGGKVIQSCEEMLRDGFIDQEGYLKCLGIVKEIEQQALYKFLVLGGVAVLIGGGFLLLKARR